MTDGEDPAEEGKPGSLAPAGRTASTRRGAPALTQVAEEGGPQVQPDEGQGQSPHELTVPDEDQDSVTVTLSITWVTLGSPWGLPSASIFFTTSRPSVTIPKRLYWG